MEIVLFINLLLIGYYCERSKILRISIGLTQLTSINFLLSSQEYRKNGLVGKLSVGRYQNLRCRRVANR